MHGLLKVARVLSKIYLQLLGIRVSLVFRSNYVSVLLRLICGSSVVPLLLLHVLSKPHARRE
jgi:hypothetical protein